MLKQEKRESSLRIDRERRLALLRSLNLDYDPTLPIVQRREEIAGLIRENQVVVVCGETGSGKSTQLPKICLEIGRGISGTIGHTQPRRIAARSIATRLAEELTLPLGQAVGYKVRFDEKISPDSLVKLMTDGILLAESQSDKFFRQYDTIIIDEAHERSLNIDFLLGMMRRILPKRPELKLIITSATIDARRFAVHFSVPGIPASFKLFWPKQRFSVSICAVKQGFSSACQPMISFLSGASSSKPALSSLSQMMPCWAKRTHRPSESIFCCNSPLAPAIPDGSRTTAS